MTLQSIFNKVKNLPIDSRALIAIGAGAGTAIAIKEIWFTPFKYPGLPNAKNLNGFAPTMTRNEAQAILNLSNSYTYGKSDIQRQHRILMALHHPDKGGSSYIATKINEARDFLTLGAKD